MADQPETPAIPVASPGRQRRIREIDFTRPTKFAVDEQRRLEQLHDSFCRRASMRLSLEMHSGIELEVLDSDQTIWQAATSDIPLGAVMAICATRNGNQILIVSESPFLLRIVNTMLGGAPFRPLNEHELTDIDLTIIGHFMEELTEILSETWSDFAGISFQFLHCETDKAGIFPVAALNEAVLTITVEVKMADISSTMTLIFPHHAIASVQKALQRSSYRSERKQQRADAADIALRDVDVRLYAEVGGLDMTVGDLLNLREGQTLDLGPMPEMVTLYVESEPVYDAKPAYQDERHVVVVQGRKRGVS